MQIGGTKIKPVKQDTIRRIASFVGKESSAKGEAIPEEDVQDIPADLAETHGGKTTSPTTPPRSTSSISVVSSHKVTKWQPFATWQPSSTGNTYK